MDQNKNIAEEEDLLSKLREIMDMDLGFSSKEIDNEVKVDAIRIASEMSPFAKEMQVYEEREGIKLYWKKEREDFEDPEPRVSVYLLQGRRASIDIVNLEGVFSQHSDIPCDAVSIIVLDKLKKMFPK